eukprot:2099084-Rhodomonas_salina.4
MSGTDVAYGAPRTLVAPYAALSPLATGTTCYAATRALCDACVLADLRGPPSPVLRVRSPICLRARYAMSGTDVGYALSPVLRGL